MPFKNYEQKKLNHKDYMDKERFDRDDKRLFSKFAKRSFLIPFNAVYFIGNLLITNWLSFMLYHEWIYFFATKKSSSKTHGIFAFFKNDKMKDLFWEQFQFHHVFDLGLFQYPKFWLLIFLIGCILQTYISFYLYNRFRSQNNNQLGEARFANNQEVNNLLPLVPDKDIEFEGFGGSPLFHIPSKEIPFNLRRKYQIPREYGAYGVSSIAQHSHKLTIGTSGSAKGQTYVMPTIDLLSRAKEKSSIFVNDPKSENVDLFYDVLRKRGYDVQILNLINPLESMSYNPLQLAISYAKNHQYDNVQKEINSLAFSIYNDPKASDKHWQISAQSLFNSLALGLLDYCESNNAYEKATIVNIINMLSSLGATQDENSNPMKPEYELNTYFKRLTKKNSKDNSKNTNWSKLADMAIKEFSISGFAGESEGGSIKSTTMAGLTIYNQDKIGRMTSKNSFNLGRLGFPRHLDLYLGKQFQFKRAKLEFFNNNDLIEDFIVPIDETGRTSYEIKNKFGKSTTLKVSIQGTNKFAFYKLNKETKKYDNGKKIFDEYTNEEVLEDYLVCKKIQSNINNDTEISVEYKEKPTALFVVTPAFDSSYNQLTSFLISQAYKANAEASTTRAKGRKTYYPIEFLLDEYGSLPPIDDMDQKITVARSYGITFNLIIQNNKQLNNTYGDNISSIIRGNCATWNYIKTDDLATAKEVSERLGKKTINPSTMNGNDYSLKNGNRQEQLQSIDLITPEELMNLKEGETIVMATLNRKNANGKKIVPKPIFNRFDREMPYAYKLLKNTMNSNRILQDIELNPLHRYFQVAENYVTSSQFKAFSITTDKKPANEHVFLNAVKAGESSIDLKINKNEDILLFDKNQKDNSLYKASLITILLNIANQTNLSDRLTIINSINNNELETLKLNDFISKNTKEKITEELNISLEEVS